MDVDPSADLQSSDLDTHTGSSNTGSKTGSVHIVKEEEDFTKDNAASPIDLECHIQAERITKILDEALYKTKLALCLPNMVQNYRMLSSRLSSDHMDDLIFIFEQYDNPLFSASLLNMAAMDDIKAGDVSLRNRLNPELGHLIYILNSYPSLQDLVEEMIQQMKDDYIKMGEDKTPLPTLEYLLAIEKFREQMVKQMAMTAAEELTIKLNLRRLEAANAKLTQKINDITETMRREQEQFERLMSGKAEMIAQLNKELEVLNQAAAVKLKKKVLDSDRQMVLMSRTHAIRNDMLKEEETETREGYNNQLHSHLMHEKTQRARRFKVETQLLSWLQKYDTEMSDKQVEFDELDHKYEDECQKVEALDIKLAEQDLEYLPLMAEREEEYHQEMTAKLEAFRIEHAVKVIQIAWRDVMANRAEKRKLKKIWKQIKAEREKEQRRLDREEVRLRKEAEAAERKKKQKQKEKENR